MSLSRMRTAVKSLPLLHRMLLPGVRLYRSARATIANREINRFRKHCRDLSTIVPNPTFVKVGANDGVTGDPCSDILLRDAAWKGLLIEPVPYCFARLRENFADPQRFRLEQVAIGPAHGKTAFYFVDPEAVRKVPGLPDYYDQLGSFDRSHIVRHLDASLEPFIRECEVEVCALSDVLERNGIGEVHLLHIDAEGYDYEVLKTLDLAAHAPVMILLEHKHLAPAPKAEMLELLRRNGYSVRDCGADYFALNDEAHARLLRERPSERHLRPT